LRNIKDNGKVTFLRDSGVIFGLKEKVIVKVLRQFIRVNGKLERDRALVPSTTIMVVDLRGLFIRI
jgi:hypothetical protein